MRDGHLEQQEAEPASAALLLARVNCLPVPFEGDEQANNLLQPLSS